jgi:Ni,Fe-hydrogenase I cytochrome b subunit
MIEDWEIGALYWHCLQQTDGDEKEANVLVRKKYFEEFLSKKDLYLFVGTTKQFHNVGPNPFVIIGVFYPPTHKDYRQGALFSK